MNLEKNMKYIKKGKSSNTTEINLMQASTVVGAFLWIILGRGSKYRKI